MFAPRMLMTPGLVAGMAVAGLLAAGTAMADEASDFTDGLTGLGDKPSPAARPTGWEARQQATEKAVAAAKAKPAKRVNLNTLSAGDKVKVNVYGEDDLSGTFEIDGSGSLALPLIGEVSATGLTPRQLEQRITKALADGYLVNPRVNIEVLNFRPFFILGEVNKPGSYSYASDMTVINAVALAGGYTPRAKTGKVLVRRAADPRHKEVYEEEDAKVMPGDVVRVEERFF